MADQLIRETQPPAGTPNSPVPQYRNPETGEYERLEGAHGASRATLYGPNGQPINTNNRLPVDAEVTGNVTVTGAVEATLSGTTVEIGGKGFACDPPRTIYGKASERPSASAAHAAIPYVYYVAVDTGEVTQTDGSDWNDAI